MIFTFKYVEHPVENLHKWIEHLMLEVWCKADGPFNTNKLHPSFSVIVEEIKKLRDHIENIYNIFKLLSVENKQKLAQGFINNNMLDKICAKEIEPMTYEDVKTINEPLANQLAVFFPYLYTDVLGLASFTKRCGVLKDFYDAFMRENSKGKCPFCGLSDLKSDLLSKREAYDHYLPKALYPFNSVNFKNLIPTCNTCNSSYKGTQQMIWDKLKKRRKAFYPYSLQQPDIDFKVIVENFDIHDSKKSNITVEVCSTTQAEELSGWLEVYGLQQRYEDKCKSEDALYWIEQITDELLNHTENYEKDFLRMIELRKKRPYLEYNFLRIPFLLSYKKKFGFLT